MLNRIATCDAAVDLSHVITEVEQLKHGSARVANEIQNNTNIRSTVSIYQVGFLARAKKIGSKNI